MLGRLIVYEKKSSQLCPRTDSPLAEELPFFDLKQYLSDLHGYNFVVQLHRKVKRCDFR